METVEHIKINDKVTYSAVEKIKAAQQLFTLGDLIGANPGIECVNLNDRFFGYNEIKSALSLLKNCHNVRELYLGNNPIGDNGIIPIIDYLKHNPNIKVLNLKNSGISDQGIIQLSYALVGYEKLEHLDLYFNKITGEGLTYLVESLKSCSSLSFLNLRYNVLGDKGAFAVSNLLKSNQSIAHIYLGANGFTAVGLKAIAESVRCNIGLQTLDLGTNNLSGEVISPLLDAFLMHQNIHTVNLERNQINNTAALLLAHFIKKSSRVKVINLRYSQIDEVGAQAICSATIEHPSLEKLFLGGNIVRKVGSAALANSLISKNHLSVLDLEDCTIWEDGAKCLAKALQENTSLSELSLQRNTIRDEGAEGIAHAIILNKSLKVLHLEHNSINDRGIKSLLNAIMSNQTLQVCHLAHNSPSPIAREWIGDIENKLVINVSESIKQISNPYATKNMHILLLNEARNDLSSVLNSDIQWERVDKISEYDRRNLILRAFIKPPLESFMPRSVVIKKMIRENDESWDTNRYLHEWTATQFLSANIKTAKVVPSFYAVNVKHEFFIIEDLGELHTSLVDVLAANSSYQKIATIFTNFAKALAYIHSNTIGKSHEFNKLIQINKLNMSKFVTFTSSETTSGEVASSAIKNINKLVQLTSKCLDEMQHVIAAVENTEEFYGFVHGDLCPDNLFLHGDDVYIFDFESGNYNHVLLDLASIRMCFPSCWCAQQLPADIICLFEDAYKKQLMLLNAVAYKDEQFYENLTICCAYWLLKIIGEQLSGALEQDRLRGISFIRQRILAQLKAFETISKEHNKLIYIRETVTALITQLSIIWESTSILPLYQAFRGE